VLAIGIVVDDAIVVVENVERNIEEGRTPLEAAHQAMAEVSGPIVALVLCAVFVPMAFLTGVTGTFYKQFAVTIAISTVISAINSLTLSPALATKLLHSRGARKDMFSRLARRLLLQAQAQRRGEFEESGRGALRADCKRGTSCVNDQTDRGSTISVAAVDGLSSPLGRAEEPAKSSRPVVFLRTAHYSSPVKR
jgi:multidrug efflux pump subunit AcrB